MSFVLCWLLLHPFIVVVLCEFEEDKKRKKNFNKIYKNNFL